MKVGRITSLEFGPKRNVEVRISPVELFSAISEPPGIIKGTEVVSFDVLEKRRWWRSPRYHLYVRLCDGRSVLFYTAVKQFDVAFLLDELEASFRNVQRSWKKEPNKAPEPTPMSVTPRAPSSTSRAGHGRGSS